MPARRSCCALCGDGLKAYLAAAEEALADDGDPWEAFARFMRRVVDADASLTSRLAGTFTPTDELNRDATLAQELNQRLFERTQAAGAIGPTSTSTTSPWSSSSSRPSGSGRDPHQQLRHRYLALLLEAMRGPGAARC